MGKIISGGLFGILLIIASPNSCKPRKNIVNNAPLIVKGDYINGIIARELAEMKNKIYQLEEVHKTVLQKYSFFSPRAVSFAWGVNDSLCPDLYCISLDHSDTAISIAKMQYYWYSMSIFDQNELSTGLTNAFAAFFARLDQEDYYEVESYESIQLSEKKGEIQGKKLLDFIEKKWGIDGIRKLMQAKGDLPSALGISEEELMQMFLKDKK